MRTLLQICLVTAFCFAFSAGSAKADVITDFSNFAESGNMLNSASHDREQNFNVLGTDITIVHDSITTGSAGQEMFGTTEFASFLTDGYRLEVELVNIDFQVGSANTERVGLLTASSIPAGGPASGDVRSMGDYFYWAYQAGSVRAGMYTSGGVEEEGGFVSVGQVGIDITGLYMVRNGGQWDLGYIDENGLDVYVQSRSSINGEAITTDGTVIGLYSDMRTNNSVYELRNLSYTAPVPEPGSFAVIGLSIAGLAFVSRRRK